jgi:hypothetical protein
VTLSALLKLFDAGRQLPRAMNDCQDIDPFGQDQVDNAVLIRKYLADIRSRLFWNNRGSLRENGDLDCFVRDAIDDLLGVLWGIFSDVGVDCVEVLDSSCREMYLHDISP